jgi:hypothetical protein
VSQGAVPTQNDPQHGEHVEEDRPTVDQPRDESDPDTWNREGDDEVTIDPSQPPPAHPVKPT